MENVFEEIREERKRQEEKWGEQNHPSLDQVLLNRDRGCEPERMCEEYEIPTEARAKFLCSLAEERKQQTFARIAVEELCEAVSAESEVRVRAEVVQLAAVCVKWIEAIDRRIK